ncbi:MAG: hypothetical protein WBC84_19635, partial [Pseudolabrys sp.]
RPAPIGVHENGLLGQRHPEILRPFETIAAQDHRHSAEKPAFRAESARPCPETANGLYELLNPHRVHSE